MPYRVLKQSKIEKRATAGTIIYGFIGHRYGVDKLDTKRFGKPYGAFTLGPTPFDYPFFTMPMEDVEEIEI